MSAETLRSPDLSVTLSDGSAVPLKEFWKNRGLVLVFLRHFGWPFCREQVAQLRRNRVRFEKAGANLLLVGMGTPGECSDFKNKFDVPFPMVSDPEKKLYQAFELKQMPPWKALSPALALKGISAVARGHGLGIPVGDVRQLPGVFVIDRKGSVAFSWPADDPSGHPSVEEILSAVDSLRRPAK